MLKLYDSWVKSAAVRGIIEFDQSVGNGYFYPEIRQPLLNFAKEKLLGHPDQEKILAKKAWVLQQSFYYYLTDVASIETKFICNVNSGIIDDAYSVKFDHDTKIVSSTIIVDEGFHANTAMVAKIKIMELTGIEAIKVPAETNLDTILKHCYTFLAAEHHNDFNLLVNCILENTLTKDLDLFVNNKTLNNINSYTQIILEQHFRDEARHSVFAYKIMKYTWSMLDENKRITLLPIIKMFVTEYLRHNFLNNVDFNKILLANLDVSYETAIGALEYCKNFTTECNQILYQNLLHQFKNIGIDYPE